MRMKMASLSQVDFQLRFAELLWLPGTLKHAKQGVFPGGMDRNRDHFSPWLDVSDILDSHQTDLLYDPQTSGGLLMSVRRDSSVELLDALRNQGESAAVIGEVVEGNGKLIVLHD